MLQKRAPLPVRSLWLPILLGLTTVGLALGHLLEPDVVLAFRDLPFFHLPLRTTLGGTGGGLLPLWNSGLHGGQPILSNPNYAAFYPATWLTFVVAPFRSIPWLLILHGLLAYGGAWRLLAKLGAGLAARALGAVAFFAGGAILASTNTLNLYSAMALFPWIMAAGILALESEGSWLPDAFWAGLGLALQLLAGAPEAVLISAITLLALAFDSPRGRWRRLLAAAALATLIASVQLLPTLDRIAGSARAGGLDSEEALVWSLPPLRIAELAYPRIFGDPSREMEDLFFGWGIHDRDHPYVVSIYPGLLVLCIGLASLVAFPIPHRRAWTVAAGVGLLLALGRHNPVYRLAVDWLPWLGAIRYPEKFVLLPTSCLAIAGALGWDHLLRARATSDRLSPRLRLPLAMALAILGGGALLTALLHLYPQAAADFIAAHRGSPTSVPLQIKGLVFLRNQAWMAMAMAASTALLLAALRRSRISSRSLATVALLLLTADLLYYARGTTPVVEASEILQAPAAWREMEGTGQRIFAPSFLASSHRLRLRRKEIGTVPLRSRLERLAPYVATLWGFQYVVHADFDRMATRWARHTASAYLAVADDRELAERFLGAWDVAFLVDPRPIEDLLRDRLEGREPLAAFSRPNRHRRARVRLPREALFHGSAEAALAAARGGRFAVEREEHLIGERRDFALTTRRGEILESDLEGDHIEVHYRSDDESVMVLAVTYDDGWQGSVGQREVELYATALGETAAVIPPGEATLVLRFRQPFLRTGISLSLIGLVLLGTVVLRSGSAASGRMPR